MINTVSLVITSLCEVLFDFLSTDICLVFLGVIVVALLIRCVIMICSLWKEVFKND